MNDLVKFEFEGKGVRTVLRDGEPWFVTKDVCEILGIQNHRDALTRIPEKHKGVASTDTLGGIQNLSTISEAGLYRLVLRSDKPQAEPFIDWVTAEVLPQILSKHGLKEKAMENLPMNRSSFGKTMSSREIAELTEKEHFNVCRDIRTLVNQGAFNDFKFELVDYTDAKGEKRPEYLLDFDATMTLVTGYNAVLRAKVIKRWRELEQKEFTKLERKEVSLLPAEIAVREFKAYYDFALTVGLEGNAARISADNTVRRERGISLLKTMQIELKSENQEQMFTPTQIGEILGFEGRKGAKRVNSLLAELDYQERIGDSWVVTEEGKPHAVLLDTGKKHKSGTMVQQIKWKESVIPKLEKLLDDDDD